MMTLTSGLKESKVLYLQQSDRALKAGVFHNDVCAVGFGHTYLCHEDAYRGGLNDLEKLTTWYNMHSEKDIDLVVVPKEELSLEDAVECYLFNTQWLIKSDGDILILAPKQCQTNVKAMKVIESWLESHSNWNFEYFDLDQSMNNGGGPACLRLRIPLTKQEYQNVHHGVKLDHKKAQQIKTWINQHYPEQFELSDLLKQSFRLKQDLALEELYQILDLPTSLLGHSYD